MPPRTNQRKRAAEDEVAVAKAAAKRAAKAAKVMQGVADASSASQLAINSTLQAYLCECDAKIKDFFKDSMDGPPTIFSGLPVYDPVAATQALSSGNKYTCSAPLFWINTSYELQPNVPKYRKRLESLRDHFFSQPTAYPETILVSMAKGEIPHKCKGALKAVSIPELRDSLRLAVAESIQDPDVPRKVKMAWKDVLMSVPFTFEVMDEHSDVELAFRTVVQAREDVVVKKENMMTTSLMRIYEVIDFKKRMEKIVGKQGKTALVEKYAKVQYAKGSEVVKPSFIEVACMLHSSCLSIPKVAATLMQLDEQALNPLDSIYKLREVCIQCEKREPLQIWCFTMIADFWIRTDGRDPIPIRALGNETSESVSMVKLFLFKKQLRDYLWKEMDSNYTVWDAAIRSEIRRVTESLEACRTCLGYFNATKDSGNADEDVKALKGRAQWPASADSFLVVMEALVFSYGHDSVISQQLRNRRSIEDILNHTDIRSYMQKVTNAYKTETGGADEVTAEEIEAETAVIVDQLAETANLSEAERLLKMATEEQKAQSPAAFTQLEAGLRVAERNVANIVQLVVDDPDAPDTATAAMKETAAAQIRGVYDSQQYVLIVLDSKTLCESGSQAKYRLPPTRPGHVKRLLDIYLGSRDDGDLDDSDILVALDGSKGNDWEQKSVIKHLPGKKYQCYKNLIVFTHESVEQRQERASKSQLDLVETVNFITVGVQASFKVQPRLELPGTTRGNVLGPVAKPAWSTTWQVTAKTKRQMFGESNLPLPGGSCPVSHEQESAPRQTQVLPVFYHECPPIVGAEISHLAQAAAVIDLTPGSGHFALHCVRHRVPYVGVAMTQLHKDLLERHLVSQVLMSMTDSNDTKLFDPSYAELVKDISSKTGGGGQAGGEQDGDAEKPSGVAKPKPKPKAEVKPPVEGKDAAREALLQKIKDAAAAPS